MSGHRFALVLADGEPADPPAFVTVIPGWEVGDTFLAGKHLARFWIRAIDVLDRAEAREMFNEVWVVEPL